MNSFKLAETGNFNKKVQKNEFRNIYLKIKNYVYPQLISNPFFGNNIKKLKGEFENVYRYRIGNYRLFYTIEKQKILILILDIEHRQNSYNK